MSTRNMLNAFFHPDDQDAFARTQGWQDAEQMCYYEDQSQEAARVTEDEFDANRRHWETIKREIPPMTDNEVEQLVEQEQGVLPVQGTVEYLAPPPNEILVFRQEVDDILKRAEQMRLDELASIHEKVRQYEMARGEDDEACPLRAWYDTGDELAGVF